MDDELLDDDYIDIELRSREEIAARLFILEALTLRFIAEAHQMSGEPIEDLPEEIYFDLKRVLRDAGMMHALVQSDKRSLTAKLGRMSRNDFMTLMNQVLAGDSIAMHCGLIPWRPFWALVDEDAHFRLDLNEDSIPELAARLTLPSDEDVARAQETAELWTWRMFWEGNLRQLSGVDRIAALETIEGAMAEVRKTDLVTLGEDGDMTWDGKPLSSVSDDVLGLYSMFAMMREKSINWLCGMGPNWDKVPSINAV